MKGWRKIAAALAVVVLALPLVAEAQQAGKVWRIGYLSGASPDVDRAWVAALQDELRKLGYVEGANAVIEKRHAAGRSERLPELVAELVRLKVDVFVVWGDPAVRAISKATTTIPIVLAVHADPVGAGFAASLARPGGQVTGLSDFHSGTVTKRVELLKEAVPAVTRVAVLFNPEYATTVNQFKSIQAAEPALGVTVIAMEARNDEEIEGAFGRIGRERPGALVILPQPSFTARRRMADLAIKHRLPSVATVRQWAEAGVMMSYGASFVDLWRRAATYVDKILKGAKPADLPIEQPTKFELVINMKTAKALGITIPPSLLLRADYVIE